ncbi:MAG TPA: aminopeptidase P family N-terminal domain-containing protein [Stellaceae bacterium]|nr:aminopeptidase P family N-terminal domain-containing protein [Stellaceae bacterium]
MRRGLIAWSRTELPEAALDARVERVRTALAASGLDALAVYTNNTQPAGVSWLCGFVPYWSEAMLVLTRDGAPRLVAALSKRVRFWIEATSRIAEVVSAARIGTAAGQLAVASGAGRVGVAGLDTLPAGIAADMRAAGATLVDVTALFAQLRGRADPAEVALAAHAGAIAHAALTLASRPAADANAAIAAVEEAARQEGAEECYVAIAPDLARGRPMVRLEGRAPLGARFAIRATVAYKGAWVRAARTVFRDRGESTLALRAAERLAAAVAVLPDARGFDGFRSWLVEGCRVAQPLAPLMGSRLDVPVLPGAAALVSVQACLDIDGGPVMLGAPALIGDAGEAAGFLVPPVYA